MLLYLRKQGTGEGKNNKLEQLIHPSLLEGVEAEFTPKLVF